VASFADTSRQFLNDNGDNMIRLGQVSAAQLRVFAKNAPEYHCLTGGIVAAGKLQAEAFRGFVLHIVLETLQNQPRGYTPRDKPRYGEKRGPHCGSLPTPPYSQSNPVRSQPNMDDGVDEPTGKGTDRAATGFGVRATDSFGWAGSPAETGLLKSLLAPTLGLPASDVPDLGALLLGPMARGAKVGYR
jgi:phospholipid/cholesterol/gamma-HCH transport system substrate-binding protein